MIPGAVIKHTSKNEGRRVPAGYAFSLLKLTLDNTYGLSKE